MSVLKPGRTRSTIFTALFNFSNGLETSKNLFQVGELSLAKRI